MSLLFPDPVAWCDANWRHDSTATKAGERWRIHDAPFLADIMRDYARPGVNEVTLMCAAQGAKSTTTMALQGWSIACNPDTMMMILPSQTDAEEMGERLVSSLNACEATARLLPSARYAVAKDGINFATGKLFLKGTGGKGNKVSSKPIGNGYGDEIKDMDPAAVAKFRSRLVSRGEFYKYFQVSTPDHWEDSIHQDFLSGNQNRWHLKCPQCGEIHRFGWRLDEDRYLIKYDKDETDIQKLLDGVHYMFPCGHVKLTDCKHDRRWIVDKGFWLPTNHNAPDNLVSYTWNALLPPWVTWKYSVQRWLKAMSALKGGDVKTLSVFISEVIGEPNEQQEQSEPITLNLADYLIADYWRDTYDSPIKRVDGEVRRYFSVDHQKGRHTRGELPHRWGTAWAVRADGSARLLYAGRLETADECRDVQLTLDIADADVFVDIGWNQDEIAKELLAYGWTGIKGDDGDDKSFLYVDKNGTRTWRMFSRIETITVGMYKVPFVRVAKQRLLDVLAQLRGDKWEIGKDVSKTYLKHQSGCVQKEVDAPKGGKKWVWTKVGPDHMLDCTYYCLAAAVIGGYVGGSTIDTHQDEDIDGVDD